MNHSHSIVIKTNANILFTSYHHLGMHPKSLSLLFFLLLIVPIRAVAQETDAEVLKYITTCVVDKDKLTQIDSITIQINNRAGDKYGEVEIPYSKDEKVSDIAAWIELPDGTKIRGLKKSEMVDKSAISDISLYEDHYKKCFQLKHNSYPYLITYTYKTSFRNYITLADWSPVYDTDIPTRTAKLKIILPRQFAYNTFTNRITAGKIDTTALNVILEWKASYDKPIKNEIYSQPETKTPYVIVSPLYFQYGEKGSTKDWASFGNWQYRLITGLDVLPDEEKATVSALIHGIEDKREIIKTLYHYLQDHTRYINVSIGIGGLKPYPASYVAQNKYGDCKALTNYMKALLNYAGIESFYTVVHAGEQPKEIIKDYHGSQFNHAILAVPLNRDTIWLDNTANIYPFGYMGTFTQNREALLIDRDHSRLVRIPSMAKKENQVVSKIEFDCNVADQTFAMINISFKGRDYERFMELHSDLNNNEKDQIIRDYLSFDNCEVLNWELKKQDRDTARIALQAKLNLFKFLKPLGEEFYFSLYPVSLPPFTVPAVRTDPVVLPYPIFHTDTLIYKLPTGYEVKSQLEPASIKTRFGTYDLTMQVVDGKLSVVKQFVLFSGNYPLEQYPDFYNFIQSIKKEDRKGVIIHKQ